MNKQQIDYFTRRLNEISDSKLRALGVAAHITGYSKEKKEQLFKEGQCWVDRGVTSYGESFVVAWTGEADYIKEQKELRDKVVNAKKYALDAVILGDLKAALQAIQEFERVEIK